MLNWLLTLDTVIFHFINETLANPVTDVIMPIVTNDWILRILFALIVITLLAAGGKRFFWVVLFAILVVVLSDQSSSALLKPLIGRARPCQIMDVHLLVNCGSGKAFPSSHAANLFAQALFFGLLFRRYRWYFVVFAGIVGISRIFVGVHYPLDVLGGLILGGIEGGLMAWIFMSLNRHNKLKPKPYVDYT